MRGSPPRRGFGQGSGVDPALHPDEPGPYPWPSDNTLEFGALPTAVACARLHARNLLWEWGLDWLAPDVELLVGEGYNHFEMLETLANPYGLLGRAVLGQMGLLK